MEKKVLSIGRHGIKDNTFGISPESMVQVYLSAKTFNTEGKTLILSSPIERALTTAKIRAKVWNAPLIIKEELHEAYLSKDFMNRLSLLCENCFEAAKEGDYDHLHMVTHLPITDDLNFPSCNPASFFVLEDKNWEALQKRWRSLAPHPMEYFYSSLEEAATFFTVHQEVRRLFANKGTFSLEKFYEVMAKLMK